MSKEKIKKKPIVTIKNLKARAENGSLLSIKGLVVINAEDHKIINIKGNILTILFYKLKNVNKSYKLVLFWTIY